MKAVDIIWDTDGESEETLNLPTEVEIPEELISNYREAIDYWRGGNLTAQNMENEPGVIIAAEKVAE
jgi:hypothetical protein